MNEGADGQIESDGAPNGGAPGALANDVADAAPNGPRRLDFADPARLPSLDALVASAAGRIAAELSRELGDRLRFEPACASVGPERRAGRDIAAGLAPGALCLPIALKSPAGEAWLLVRRTLVSALADRRYGGSGSGREGVRPLAPSEQRLVATLREAMCLALERAWRPITPLVAHAFELPDDRDGGLGRERFAANGASELWHECALRIDIDAGAGEGNDAEGRDPDCTVLLAHSCIAGLAPRTASPVHRPVQAFGEAFAAGVRGCGIELVGVLAEQRITLGALAGLRPGDFIALDERRPVRFRAGDRAVFDARMGLDDGRVSANVTRLHLPLRGGQHDG